jgi:hypothetical protein
LRQIGDIEANKKPGN